MEKPYSIHKKTKYRILWNRVIIAITILVLTFYLLIIFGINIYKTIFNQNSNNDLLISNILENNNLQFNEIDKLNQNILNNQNETNVVDEVEDKETNVQETPQEAIILEINKTSYRLTSFYANDGYDTGSCTGSGLCEKDFQINDRGWYTYNGYLVLAGATTYMQKYYGVIYDKEYYKYYDIVNITIDGNTYQGIIIDSCGACSKITTEQRLDIFVSSKEYVIDRGYKGNGMVEVWKED